jgi:hypothetical protein
MKAVVNRSAGIPLLNPAGNDGFCLQLGLVNKIMAHNFGDEILC